MALVTRTIKQSGVDGLSYFDLDGTGDFLSCGDAAAFDITGDIDIRVGARFDDVGFSNEEWLLARWDGGDTNEQHYGLNHQAGVTALTLIWRNSGGSLVSQASDTGLAVNTDRHYRATLDVVNGTDRVITFYRSDETMDIQSGAISWTQHSQHVISGTTSIQGGGLGGIFLGERSDAPGQELDGRIFWAEVLDGIGGTKVINPDFRTRQQHDWSLGTAGTDDFGNSWTQSGSITWVDSGTDYTSPTAWEADVGVFGTDTYQGLISDNEEYDEGGTLTLLGSTGTPSITSYLWLTVDPANRHAGVAGTGHARMRMDVTANKVISIEKSFTRVDWLEVQLDTIGDSDEAIRVTIDVTDVLVDYCVIWSDQDHEDQDGIYCGGSYGTLNVNISNCIIYGFLRAQIIVQNFSQSAEDPNTGSINHCTLIHQTATDSGTPNWGGVFLRASHVDTDVTYAIFNTIAYSELGTTSEGFADGGGPITPATRTTPEGTVTWNGSHNLRGDLGTENEIDGTNNLTDSLFATDGDSEASQSSGAFVVFQDITPGTENFLLLDAEAGNLAARNGTNRQGSEPDARQDFSVAIDGPRPTSGVDIGASQFAESAQYIYPDGDIQGHGWDSAPTGGQALFQQIDEDPIDLADYIFES